MAGLSLGLGLGLAPRIGGGGPEPVAPANTVLPAITGTAYVGQTLSVSNGTWTGTAPISYGYQWKRDGASISGATSSTYQLATGDLGKVVTCTVTATNVAGSASATSSGTATVIATPANTALPAISGTATVGQTLTCSTGTWTGGGSISYAYQWKADGVSIGGATASTYQLTSNEVGKVITCTVTATNAAGSASATSAATGAVVGSPPAYRSYAFDPASGVTALNLTYPAGVAANDILLMGIIFDPTGGTGVSFNIPSGFARIGTEQTTASGHKTGVFWKRATGSESGDLALSLNGTMAAARIFYGLMAAYSGAVASGDPIDAYSETVANVVATGANATMAALTTVGANRRCVAIFLGNDNDSLDPTTPHEPTWAVRANEASLNGNDGRIDALDIVQASAGSPVDCFIKLGTAPFECGIHAVALKP